MYGMDVFMLKKLHYFRSRYQKATVSASMLAVPGHNCATSTKYITYLLYYSWKQHGGLETFNSYWS